MDGSRFDDFARALVTSRRSALRTLLGGAVAGIAAVVKGEAAQACSSLRRRCAADAECCSGACDPASGRCVCGPGTEECGRDCFANEQYQTDADNCGGCRNRCRGAAHGSAVCTGSVCGIACDAGYALCGGAPSGSCCADSRECCNGDCCGPNQCCSAEGCVLCRCGIGIDSFDNGEINPDNACQYCDPTRDRDDWTTTSDGTFCGDGRVCCNGECCSPTECCDGVQCTDVNCPDQCEIQGQPVEAGQTNGPGSCQVCDPESNRFDWTLLDDQAPCGGVSGRVCCNGECCSPNECCGATSCEECGPHCRIGDADIAAGVPNPADPCEVCTPDESFTTWSTADDDTECGVGRVCCAGECCPAGQCCTDGACGECRCAIGTGEFDRNDVNPFNACEICDPDRDRDDWSPGPNNIPCGLTNDRFCCNGVCCQAGECCNAIGECEPCGCVISGEPVQENAVNPANTCQVCNPNRNRRDWTVLDDDAACGGDADDRVCCGGACCEQGECCDDGACRPCGCEIGDDTIEPETPNPDNVCQVCDPSRARFAWSPVLGEVACGADGSQQCCGGECCAEDECCILDACGECLCAIGTDTYAEDAPNPENGCQVCDPRSEPFDWSNLPDKAPCSDHPDQICCGGTCCEEGECCVEGACGPCQCAIDDQLYDEGAVNPQNECEICRVTDHTPGWGPVDDQTVCGENGDQVCCGGVCCGVGECCTLAGTCLRCRCEIDGVTYDEGTTNPESECEVCDPQVSTTAWSPAVDETSCAEHFGQVCCAGLCCPQGQCCVGGACGPCDACTIDGVRYDAGARNPSNRFCEVCDPSRGTTSWSPGSDDVPCALDAPRICCNGVCCGDNECCDAGSGVCDADACEPEVCTIDVVVYENFALNPGNDCEECNAFESTTSWSFRGTATCGPTGQQFCNTQGVCCPLGHCPDLTVPGFCGDFCDAVCVIDGVLYFSEEIEPTGGCQICAPSVSHTSWTFVC